MNKRERFISEMRENLLLPYEACRVYEEQIVGEFENRLEFEHFNRFCDLAGKNAFVLDLACGDGRHTLRLSERTRRVVAFDLSPAGLQMAGKKCQAQDRIAFARGSMLEFPFRKHSFDGIWFSQAFEYVPPDRREGFIASLERILKSAGVLFMSVETWMYPSLWLSAKELWGDLRLFCYWKFLKGKPLLWGEFLYHLPPGDIWSWHPGWHYHVHTDRWTLLRLLHKRFEILKLDLFNGYLYAFCRKRSTAV